MEILNGEYTFDSKDPIFGFGGKIYNAKHLSKEQIGVLIIDGCKLFKKNDKKVPATPPATNESK